MTAGILLATLASACVGSIDGRNVSVSGPASGAAGSPETTTQGSAGAGGTVAMGATVAMAAKEESAGPWQLRRLTTREYDNTVADLLGVTGYGGIPLPNDAPGETGFTFPADATEQHARLFREAAQTLADAALKGSWTRLVPCAPTSGSTAPAEDACALQFIRNFGKSAFRRPLGEDEVDELVALYRQIRTDVGYDFKSTISLLVQAFLQSPRFLYHQERGLDAPIRQGDLIRLAPYEVASRLSYLLWETMPDATLFAAADAGALAAEKDVVAQAERLLSDPRAARSLGSFHQQWLQMGTLGRIEKDAGVFPSFATAIRPSLEAEFDAFVQNVYNGDARLESLLTSPVAFATAQTAALYGLPPVVVAALQPGVIAKVDLDPTQRAGLLTQLAFLSAKASLVRRGVAVYKFLLCGQVAPPPKSVENEVNAQTASAATEQEKAAARKAQASCAACHQYMDPAGFAFENYDAVGQYRKVAADGSAIDSSGLLPLPSGQTTFADAVGLLKSLAKTEEARRCVTRQWFRYALGRVETADEQPTLDRVYDQLAAEGSFDLRKLVLAVTQSRSFLFRSPSPGEAP